MCKDNCLREIELSGNPFVPKSCMECGFPFGGPCKYKDKEFELDQETWIVVDTKLKCHGLVRHFLGTTLTEEQATKEADYFNWSWDDKERFKAIKVKITFEILK